MLAGPKVSVTAYDSEDLRALRSTTRTCLDAVTAERACLLGLRRRRRGCRAGQATQARRQRPTPYSRPVGNGASVIVGNRQPARLGPRARVDKHSRQPRVVTVIHVPRCAEVVGRALTFGSINVQSLSSTKLDVLLEVQREHCLDVMLLCETWHDPDSVSIRRLRADGFTVVERARPRSRAAATSLGVNHGGVAVVASAGLRLSAVNLGVHPTTFECVAARVQSATCRCLVVVLYRPGSAAVTTCFFAELTDLLDRVSTYADPVVLAGDLNLRLERQCDPYALEFNNLLSDYGLLQHVCGPTHDLGGTLDVVCTRSDLPAPSVQVTDVGISDHRLLCWSSHLRRELPTYTSTSRRSWRLFDLDTFTTDLLSSSLCNEQHWQGLDADGLAMLYDVTATQLLDSQVPVRRVTCRRRPSSAWFDDECRQVKRSLRTAEKAARKAGPLSDTSLPAVSEWRVLRRQYFSLLRQKRAAFWSARIDADQHQPSRLWRSFDELLGRGRAPVVTDISASVLHDFFDDKVAAVRAATANADAPHFTPVPAGCVLNEFLPVTPADVVTLIKALPDKQSASDPLLTWLLKRSADLLAPFLCQLFNRSSGGR